MRSFSFVLERLARVPPFVRILALTVAVSFVAVLAFKVAIATVTAYALFALLCGSHLFMHGSHGGHHDHKTYRSTPQGDPTVVNPSEDQADHQMGCH